MFKSKYEAKFPDTSGVIHYDDEENLVWHDLYQRQLNIVQNYASQHFLDGIDILSFPIDRVPQVHEINKTLGSITGWGVEPVSAIIPAQHFFTLLSERRFPAANFIRRREDFNYITEPDIFHEYFGHLPMLTDPVYANFMEQYGKMALKANDIERHYLAKLYWFTVEFGLIETPQGYRNYGGGILSSPEETVYAIDSDEPERRALDDGLAALRTPYRIDMLQRIYYVINDYSELYKLLNDDLFSLIQQAQILGDFAPTFPLPEEGQEGVMC